MKKYWPLILILLLTGCRAKKELLKTEVRQSDSLFVKSEVIKAPVLSESLIIENICDSITGEVIRFKKVFVVNGDSITLLTDKNNALRLNINNMERTLSEKDVLIQKLKEELSQVKETVIYKKHLPSILIALLIGFAIGLVRPWRWF